MEAQIPLPPIWLIIVLFVWTIIFKGIALWRAAGLKQRNWFIVMLIINNDLGVLEIIYLFWFAKKRLTLKEIKSWLPGRD